MERDFCFLTLERILLYSTFFIWTIFLFKFELCYGKLPLIWDGHIILTQRNLLSNIVKSNDYNWLYRSNLNHDCLFILRWWQSNEVWSGKIRLTSRTSEKNMKSLVNCQGCNGCIFVLIPWYSYYGPGYHPQTFVRSSSAAISGINRVSATITCRSQTNARRFSSRHFSKMAV